LRQPPPAVSRRFLWSLPLLLGLFIASWARGAGDLNARVSGPAPDGTLELTLEVGRAPLAEPDLSALLQDFEILASRNKHQSFMVNGRRTDSISLILTLKPKREGIGQIPPISYGDETTEALPLDATAAAPSAPQLAPSGPPLTQPLSPPPASPFNPTLGPFGGEVQAPQPGPSGGSDLVLETEIKPQSVRVRQQAVLTGRVLAPQSVAGTIARPRLYDPKVSGASLVPLGEDEYQVTRQGTIHEVYERRYALFPTQTGTLTIEPLVADAWVGGPGVQVPAQQRVTSTPLSLEVEGAALGPAGKAWLPARAVTLSEEQPGLARVQTGETWQRIIVLRVEGQPASALPQLSVPVPSPLVGRPGYPVLRDERLPDGLVGTRREVILISAPEPGLYRLPAVRLDWWNTATEGWETAVLPARELEVTAAPAPSAHSSEPAQQMLPSAEPPAPGPRLSQRLSQRPGAGSPWIWLLIGLGLGWMGFHLVRRARGTSSLPGPAAPVPKPAEPLSPPEPDPLAKAMDAVHEAYRARQPAAARQALLTWARLAWPHDPPGNLTQLALRSPEPARSRIMLLDKTFFSPDPLDWSREPVWEDLPAIAAAAALEPPPPPPKRRIGTPRPRPE